MTNNNPNTQIDPDIDTCPCCDALLLTSWTGCPSCELPRAYFEKYREIEKTPLGYAARQMLEQIRAIRNVIMKPILDAIVRALTAITTGGLPRRPPKTD